MKKIKTAEKEYPELYHIAKYVTQEALCILSEEKRALLRGAGTNCPYPAQCILEMVIAELEKCV